MKKTLGILLCVQGLTLSGNVLAAPADEVKVLLEQENPQAAYALARANLEQMGDPTFDFYYGIAAVESGRAGEGVLALERYLLQFPDNGSARFQLAKAYFMLGEDQSAREEFSALLPQAVDKEKIAIERYLDAIRTRESRYRPSANVFLDAGLGYDSNINAGMDAGASASLPGGTVLPPLANNAVAEKEAAPYYTVGVGASGAYPLQPGLTLVGSAGIDTRKHVGDNDEMFDQSAAGLSGGLAHLSGKNLLRAGIGVGQNWIDDQTFLRTASVSGEWAHQFDHYNRFNFSLSYSDQAFEETCVYDFKDTSKPCRQIDNSVRDADTTGIALGWTRAFALPWQPVFNMMVSYADEKNQKNRSDLSRDIVGVRIHATATPVANVGAGIGLGLQKSKFSDKFFGTSEARQDDVLSVDGFVSYFFSKQLSTRAEIQWTEQDSNVGLFDYDRYIVSVKARYEFK